MEQGKNNNGETVPTGLYIIAVTVREQAQTKVVMSELIESLTVMVMATLIAILSPLLN